MYSCTLKPPDISIVRDALLKSVCCVKDCTVGSLVSFYFVGDYECYRTYGAHCLSGCDKL